LQFFSGIRKGIESFFRNSHITTHPTSLESGKELKEVYAVTTFSAYLGSLESGKELKGAEQWGVPRRFRLSGIRKGIESEGYRLVLGPRLDFSGIRKGIESPRGAGL